MVLLPLAEVVDLLLIRMLIPAVRTILRPRVHVLPAQGEAPGERDHLMRFMEQQILAAILTVEVGLSTDNDNRNHRVLPFNSRSIFTNRFYVSIRIQYL